MKFSEVKASLLSLGQTGFMVLVSQSLSTMQMSIKHPLAAAPNKFSIEKSSTLEPSLKMISFFMLKKICELRQLRLRSGLKDEFIYSSS